MRGMLLQCDPVSSGIRRRMRRIGASTVLRLRTHFAFLDPGRLIARDASHSQSEQRYYCFGRVSTGVMTVRFTHRGDVIRIIGAGYWRRGKKIYEANSKVHR
jgi:uncharacterized DUF497 family protein